MAPPEGTIKEPCPLDLPARLTAAHIASQWPRYFWQPSIAEALREMRHSAVNRYEEAA